MCVFRRVVGHVVLGRCAVRSPHRSPLVTLRWSRVPRWGASLSGAPRDQPCCSPDSAPRFALGDPGCERAAALACHHAQRPDLLLSRRRCPPRFPPSVRVALIAAVLAAPGLWCLLRFHPGVLGSFVLLAPHARGRAREGGRDGPPGRKPAPTHATGLGVRVGYGCGPVRPAALLTEPLESASASGSSYRAAGLLAGSSPG